MVDLAPHGLTPRQIGARAMWARRKTVYGPSGFSAAGREKQAATGRATVRQAIRARVIQARNRRKCRAGHIRPTGTRCWTCHRLRLSRLRQATATRKVMPQLRQNMIMVGIRMNRNPESQKLRAMFWNVRQAYLAARKVA